MQTISKLNITDKFKEMLAFFQSPDFEVFNYNEITQKKDESES
jgi:hypothetical protein